MKPLRNLVTLAWLLSVSLVGFAEVAANPLTDHPSPYLALHADDPVDWQSWQAEIFARAQADNRMIFVSIGYFSCHWCHVMQRESFQNTEIAAQINRDLIAVKVDRELNPDLDQRMLYFVEKLRGAAGWPLNVFLTPDGFPLTGFTYLPAAQFRDLLGQLQREWGQNHVELRQAARAFFMAEMQNLDNQAFIAPSIPSERLQDAYLAQLMRVADELNGGIGDTSKFPNVPQIDALLAIIERTPGVDPDVIEFAQLTLDAMAAGNLQDQVNGGFFRYTTDPDWQTPHFEKMLYDNAQLASLYFKANGLWPERGYAEVAARTLDFVETALAHPGGGYMSSLSAVDALGREGAGYLWTRQTLGQLLDATDLAYLEQSGFFVNADSGGEFLLRPLSGPTAKGDAQRNRLILERLRRGRPPTMPADHKRLAAWNAMLLTALLDGADHEPHFAVRARRLYGQMLTLFFFDGEAIRLANDPRAARVTFEDHAQLAHAFFRYGRKFEHAAAIATARRLTETAHLRFLINDRWQQQSQSLIPMDLGHWVMPDRVYFSPMTLWLRVALELPALDPAVRASAAAMLERASRDLLDSPYSYPGFIQLRIAKTRATAGQALNSAEKPGLPTGASRQTPPAQ